MKLKTQLYIDVGADPISDTPDYRLVEFFDFESIEITSSIKTIQEVDKVFTDYSREFVVPANNSNNKIFQHFYSTKLTDGFDPRIKRRARIFLNGVFFKQGYVRLQSSQLKNGYPYSYSLGFFGALSGLEDVIGEDELSDLSYLKRYNHEYNEDQVFDGLTSGLQYRSGSMEKYGGVNPTISRDVVYPLISAEDSFFYDSDGTADQPQTFRNGTAENLYNDTTGSPDVNKGFSHTNLKPAIKVSNVIDAITDRYESVNFKSDSFLYGNQIKDLYLLLHNNKGSLDTVKGDFELTSVRFNVFDEDDFGFSTGTNYEYARTRSVLSGRYVTRLTTDLNLNVNVDQPTTDIQFYVKLYSGTQLLQSWSPTSATPTLSYTLESKDFKLWKSDLYYIVESDGGLTKFDLSLSITENDEYFKWRSNLSDWKKWLVDYKDPTITWTNSSSNTGDYTGVSDYTFLSEVDILKHIPKMKVLDFLNGLFQMFNLVADVDKNTGEIDIISLTDYYRNGSDRDITNYVDSYNYEVDRVQLYGKMDFKFSEPTTFGVLNHNEQLNDDFGNLSYPEDEDKGSFNLIFDKGNYEVKLPFEKMYYETLSNEGTSPAPTEQDKRTDICWGWLADKDQNLKLTKPVLFYNVPTSVDTSKYKFGMKDLRATPMPSSYITEYNRPSNSNSDESYSLNFGSEIDEFSLNLVENSLFNLYYRGYIINMFDKSARTLKMEAMLPLSFLFEYKLNDKLLIDGTPFRINEINTNLNTGKSQLDLITDFGIADIPTDTTNPSQVTGVTELSSFRTGFEISWDEATDNIAVTGYNIYVDGVLNKTVGNVLTTTISGLDANTLYSIQVSALDAAGNEGTLSTGVNMTTAATPSDTQAPSVPTNVQSTIITSNSIGIVWDASTDDTAVVDYRVYVNGSLDQTVSSPTLVANITGLTADTEYFISVSARDAVPNESNRSTPIDVTTLT